MKVSDLKIGSTVVADRKLWPETTVGSTRRPPVKKGDAGIVEEMSLVSISTYVIYVRFHSSNITLGFLAEHPDYEVSYKEIWAKIPL